MAKHPFLLTTISPLGKVSTRSFPSKAKRGVAKARLTRDGEAYYDAEQLQLIPREPDNPQVQLGPGTEIPF